MFPSVSGTLRKQPFHNHLHLFSLFVELQPVVWNPSVRLFECISLDHNNSFFHIHIFQMGQIRVTGLVYHIHSNSRDWFSSRHQAFYDCNPRHQVEFFDDSDIDLWNNYQCRCNKPVHSSSKGPLHPLISYSPFPAIYFRGTCICLQISFLLLF